MHTPAIMNYWTVHSTASLRKGTATVLALIFTVIFALLVLALAAMVNTSTALTRNQQSTHVARGNAESGAEYVKHTLSMLSVPASVTAEEDILDHLHDELEQLYPPAHPIAVGTTAVGGTTTSLRLPETGNITIGDNSFFAELTFDQDRSDPTKRSLTVNATGVDSTGSVSRTLSFQFAEVSSGGVAVAWPLQGIYSPGGITAGGNIKIRSSDNSYEFELSDGSTINGACIRSDMPTGTSVSMNGNVNIDGKVWIMEDADASLNGNMKINKTKSTKDDIGRATPQTLPIFEPSAFKSLATTVYTDSTTTTNIRIPAGTNPHISGNFDLNGIVYIESPNVVTISGNTKLRCTFVFADEQNDGSPASASDKLIVLGNSNFYPIDPDVASQSVADSLDGWGILAPTARVDISGNCDAFFGHLVANKLNLHGNAEFNIQDGSIIAASSDPDAFILGGNGSVNLVKTADFDRPTTGVGSTSETRYVLTPGSYYEVTP